MAEAVARRNDGEPWSEEEVEQVRELAEGNTPVGVMSVKLGRTEAAIRSKATAEGIALSPPSRSPYGDMSN